MSHEKYMSRCFELALKGLGNVAPNPMVGAVVVHEDMIIGEGYHEYYGGPHAEVNAINSVKDQSLLKESIIYVSLEPCAHYGKTPPCSLLIIEKEIPEIVVACVDTFSEVSGKGIQMLKEAGRKLTVGVLESIALNLNRRFFTFHNQKRPYIILKWAQTLDGFIDKDRKAEEKGINWITGKETKQLVHKWRSEEAGILVGKNTVLTDDPELTVREVEGKCPVRIVIDPEKELDLSHYKVGNDNAETLVISANEEDLSMKMILGKIYQANIQSIIVEGGANTLQRFLDAGLWDEARVLTGNIEFISGLEAPIINSTASETHKIGEDRLTIFRNA
jgi:diaminohydroxyphosphoribosylaminopyrimidine deaminase/5-amino-6-(5-phosphoribosylamino)uracil reductase